MYESEYIRISKSEPRLFVSLCLCVCPFSYTHEKLFLGNKTLGESFCLYLAAVFFLSLTKTKYQCVCVCVCERERKMRIL